MGDAGKRPTRSLCSLALQALQTVHGPAAVAVAAAALAGVQYRHRLTVQLHCFDVSIICVCFHDRFGCSISSTDFLVVCFLDLLIFGW